MRRFVDSSRGTLTGSRSPCYHLRKQASTGRSPPLGRHRSRHSTPGREAEERVFSVAFSLTPEQRTLRARIAAHALHAQGGTNTKAATAAFLTRFDRQVDPDAVLPPDERARRAEHARRTYMAALSLKASRARTRVRA